MAEIAGGCLCCVAGAQMGTTINRMVSGNKPDRIIIEASGLAHAASVIDELRAKPFDQMLDIGAVFTLVDPRQFTNPDYANQPLYRDQVSVADVLIANKTDMCSPEEMAAFRSKAAQLFPPKAAVLETTDAYLDIALLETPVVEKSRYRIKELPDNSMGPANRKATPSPPAAASTAKSSPNSSTDLPKLCEGLIRAKGVFPSARQLGVAQLERRPMGRQPSGLAARQPL